MRTSAVGPSEAETFWTDFLRSRARRVRAPIKSFWSLIAYSIQTRSMLQTEQQVPSVSSQNKNLITNADGSVDVWVRIDAASRQSSELDSNGSGQGLEHHPAAL